ncbi:MAG TPA: MFS transporter [Gammaproteobacteria bacterium]|nr:MFS transporter [Gammaproteobacteria bacterium]
MKDHSHVRLHLVVFALVSAAFTNIYLTQPVLPVLQREFGADLVQVSFSVSAVILGIAIANLPFGLLADRFPIRPIILVGGLVVAVVGVFCAITRDFWWFIAARFLQGLFIPALTTCLAAYVSKTVSPDRLGVVMGSYVSATVLGGLGGRLLGGWIHPPLHWRYAFVSAAVLTLLATLVAVRNLPKSSISSGPKGSTVSFLTLLTRWDLLRIYLCTMGSFAVFSSVFNYLPYRLSASPFNFSTGMITLLYLVYVLGIFVGPLSGRLSHRFGVGRTLLVGSLVLAIALGLLLLPSTIAVVFGLLALCGGFFTLHAAAVGALNRKLSSGQGKANALYVLLYYIGGWLGITGAGYVYQGSGWSTLIYSLLLLVLIPFSTGLAEYKYDRS